MAAIGLLVAGLACMLAIGVVVLVRVLAGRGNATQGSVTREWRLVQLTRVLGVVAGLVGAWLVGARGSYGVGLMLAPAVFGLCVVLAATLGETVVRPRRPAGVRSASLTPRRVRDYLPPVTTGLVVGMAVVSAATMLLTTLTASRAEDTGGLRALACRAGDLAAVRTPYPGSFYTLPLAGVLLLVLLIGALAAHQVVRRPRGLATTDAGDDHLRRRSLDVVVAATGIAVCVPYVGVGLVAGLAMRGQAAQEPGCAAGWMGPVGLALVAGSVLAVAVAVWCVTRLAVGPPAPRSPATTTTTATATEDDEVGRRVSP